jgi:hemerythrin
VDSIDKQHQKLFDMLNGLHEAMKVGKGSQTVPLILGKLVQYTREYFASEESLMLRARYTDYGKHKAEHNKLTMEVMQMVRDFEQGKIALSMDLQDFLSQWLQTHIVSSDKKYTCHLQAAGIH